MFTKRILNLTLYTGHLLPSIRRKTFRMFQYLDTFNSKTLSENSEHMYKQRFRHLCNTGRSTWLYPNSTIFISIGGLKFKALKMFMFNMRHTCIYIHLCVCNKNSFHTIK